MEFSKICSKCGVKKDINFFQKRGGKDYYRNECKNCQKIYTKQYNKNNKRVWNQKRADEEPNLLTLFD